MSLPRYSSYKDCGVVWLGEVPAHWELTRLGRVAKSIQTGPFGSQLHSDDYVEGGIPVVNPSNLQPDGIVADAAITVDIATSERLSVHQLELGDIVFGRRGEMGRCALVTPSRVGWLCGTGCLNVRLSERGDPAFVVQYLRTPYVRALLALESVGSTMDNLNTSILSSVPLPFPPTAEQHIITAFLDRETAKIDELVAEQRRLIELLKEKRQAVISHAVTKGLNPNMPMKDSGVEWLGEVPAHWEMRRFSRLVSIAEGLVDPSTEPYASMALIAPNHIEAGTGRLLGYETAAEQGADSGKYLFEEGDVIYSKIRPSLAKVVLAPCAGLCSADMYPLKTKGELIHPYLKWLLLTPGFTAWAVLESDRVAMPKINREKLAEIKLPVPSAIEQEGIVQYVEQEALRLDTLSAEAGRVIALLQERRSALISAAVTGQIDVRGLAQAEAA